MFTKSCSLVFFRMLLNLVGDRKSNGTERVAEVLQGLEGWVQGVWVLYFRGGVPAGEKFDARGRVRYF